MSNIPLIEKINESLADGNRAVLHQETITFFIDDSENKMIKLLEFMDLIESLTGVSANEFNFEVKYAGE